MGRRRIATSVRLPSEDGAQFLAGLASAAEALSSATIGTDHGQRHADVGGDGRGVPGRPAGHSHGGDRTQIVLHIEPDALTDPAFDPAGSSPAGSCARSSCAPDSGVGVVAATGPARAHLEDGPGLAWSTVRRLCCDAGVVPIVERSDGSVLDIGRRNCTIPRRFDERSPGVTRDAASPAATTRAGSTPTMSCIGLTAGRRNSRTSVCSAGSIIASSTRAGIASNSVLTARSRSAIPPDGCSSRHLRSPPAGMPLPAVARQDAAATWAGERFDLDPRWARPDGPSSVKAHCPPCSRRAFPRQRRATPVP